MADSQKDYFVWSPDDMLEITFKEKDDFLKIRETLTRMGIPSTKDGNKLIQSCHIFHKRQRYYIVHFKEMFCYDQNPSTLELSDIKRRNAIALKLASWKLITIVSDKTLEVDDDILIKVIPFKEKSKWELISKYNMGNKV